MYKFIQAQILTNSSYEAGVIFKKAFNDAVNVVFTKLNASYYGPTPLTTTVYFDFLNEIKINLGYRSSISLGPCLGWIPHNVAQYC